MTESGNTTWCVYMLECRSARIYTGVSPTPDKRLAKHVAGSGALFTRINIPERLIGIRPYPSKREALQAESMLKKLTTHQKRYMASRWREEHPIDNILEKFPALHEFVQ